MALHNDHFGRIAEKALCIARGIPFVGPYPNDLIGPAEALAVRFGCFVPHMPGDWTHTAARGARYDYSNEEEHRSLKTNTRDWKVCPQVIGQTTKQRWCTYFGLPANTPDTEIKQFIQSNLLRVLDEAHTHTFDTTIFHYHKPSNTARVITSRGLPNWSAKNLTFTKNGDAWKESSTLKANGKTICEFQIHNHRNNVKFRWNLKNLIEAFPEAFDVTLV